MVQTAETIFRDFETDGVPASGKHQPKKSEIRPWGTRLESLYSAAQAGGGLAYATKAAMDADLAHAANQIAWVMEDPTAANNGIYAKVGASGSGSWTRLGDLPYSYIKASNAGAGTANAIVATTSIPIPSADGGALIALPIVATNDASPVTVAFNGAASLTIKTSSGNDVSVGGLTSGMIVAGYVSGATFRLLTDQASAAIVADAEAAADRAEAAAAEISIRTFDAVATAEAANVAPSIDNIIVAGRNYVRVAEDYELLGPEILTNGDFATDAVWTKGSGWSISGGSAAHAVDTVGAYLTQNVAFESAPYFLRYMRTGAGPVIPVIAGVTQYLAPTTTSAGTFEAVIENLDADNFQFRFYADKDFAGTIDDVSVKKLPAGSFQSADGAWWGPAGVSVIQSGPAAVSRPLLDFLRDRAVSVTDYGAKIDATEGTGGAVTSGAVAFVDANAAFSSADIGKLIYIEGAGATGAQLATTVAAVASATSITLSDAASVSVSGAAYIYGTDNTTAINSCLSENAGKPVYVPAGKYLTTDALVLDSGTWLFGSGPSSKIISRALANGGAGYGHRQIQAEGKNRVAVSHLCLDASKMSGFATGMRSILFHDSTDYFVDHVEFVTPGAATASIGCARYRISNNDVLVSATDDQAHHDGMIDQWGGSHDFEVVDNRIDGQQLGHYLILVTGEDTDGTPTSCYNFAISRNKCLNAQDVGIWINGREGENHDFSIVENLVDGSRDFMGIAVADSRRVQILANIIKNVASNGIRLYSEGSGGGALSVLDSLVIGNVVEAANVSGGSNIQDNAAICLTNSTSGCTVALNRVVGADHTTGIYLGTSTSGNIATSNNIDPGTSATFPKIANSGANKVDDGTYSPTATGVANVTASTIYKANFTVRGDVVEVDFKVSVTPTAAGSTSTQIAISLPLTANLIDTDNNLHGMASTSFGITAAVLADPTNDRAILQFPASNTSANIFYGSFRYRLT